MKDLKQIAEVDKTTITSYFFQNGKQINNYDAYVINDAESQTSIKFSLWHENGPYRGHDDFKGFAHEDTIEKMIDFVEKKPPVQKLSICRIS